MSDVEQGAKVDAHAGAVRARETGHGSGTLRVQKPMDYLPENREPIATEVLAVELRRLQALTTWQPIETAPKDGRQVWLWWGGERRLCRWREAKNPPTIGGQFANWLPDDKGPVLITVKPTLWFPIPDRPS